MITDIVNSGRSTGAASTKKPVPAKKPAQAKRAKLPRTGFFYQIEYCPNPDCIQIHTKSLIPEIDDSTLGLRYAIDSAAKPEKGFKKKKIHPLYLSLVKIKGLKEAHERDRYSLQCLRANRLFSWEVILPKILAAIQIHIAGKRKMVALPVKMPDPEEMMPRGLFW